MSKSTPRLDTPSAILWGCAFLMAALVITQASKLPMNPAYGEMATTQDDFSLMTTNSGFGNAADPYELLWIVDSRTEMLLVYEIEDIATEGITLRETSYLPNWFRNARR